MATTPAAIAAYARSSAVTASPGEIIRMAYDRIITACDRAAAAAGGTPEGWRQVFHDETVRAQAIVLELMSVLQVNHPDPEVAALGEQLAALYQFVLDELVTANLLKKAGKLKGVRATIDGLREAWVVGVLGQ